MTEKRFIEYCTNLEDIENGEALIPNFGVKDNVTGEIINSAKRNLEMLNDFHEENNNLKQALWEAETEYIHERYYDNPIRKEESINELKEDFKRGYWND